MVLEKTQGLNSREKNEHDVTARSSDRPTTFTWISLEKEEQVQKNQEAARKQWSIR